MRTMRAVWSAMSLVALAALAASFAGAWHPLGDSLAVFRLPIALGAALGVIWTGWGRWIRWGVTGLCLAAAATAVSGRYSGGEPGELVVYQRNLLFKNERLEELSEDIRARKADLVMLQEVSVHNSDLLALMKDAYPFQIFCSFTGWSGMAVLSRLPAEGAPLCSKGRGLAGLKVMTDSGPVWALSLHLHWPYPHGQAAQRDRLVPVLETLDAPVVLAGDFNMVPWSYTFRRIAEATRTKLAGPQAPTLIIRRVPLPIDHVLAPGGGRAEVLPRMGSDHFGVLARVSLD